MIVRARRSRRDTSANLGRHLGAGSRAGLSVKSAVALETVPQGAAAQCYVAVHPPLEGVNGEYFADCNVAKSSARGRDDAMGERLWRVTEEIGAGY